TLPLHQELSYEEAVADLAFVAGTVEDRHVWTAGGLPPEVERAWRAEGAALPKAPTVVDVWRATERIFVALGDGHTFSAASVPDDSAFALDLRMVDDELKILVEKVEQPVTHVNGVSVSGLIERNRAL